MRRIASSYQTLSSLPPFMSHYLLLRHSATEIFICSICRYVFGKDRYSCKICPKFNVDLNCDSSFKYDRPQQLEERDRKANIEHFSHQHTLKFCNIMLPYRFSCSYCHGIVTDCSAYSCQECKIFIHKSRKDEMLYEVQHPYHPQHTLVGRALNYKKYTPFDLLWSYDKERCNACRRKTQWTALSCESCDFHLHYACAKPRFKRPLKNKCHPQHYLFYFNLNEEWSLKFKNGHICNEELNSSFYCCVECDVNFHLKCITTSVVEVKLCYNNHRLTLVDSINDFDFNEYYCDICEGEGNPNHHLYCSEEEDCTYYAHIDCVIREDGIPQEDSRCDRASIQMMPVYRKSRLLKHH